MESQHDTSLEIVYNKAASHSLLKSKLEDLREEFPL